ncbi:MAG: Hydrogenase maturation protein [Candidatus Methanolliviera sp. GoM_oil]|nr:MAG: Hydrogenase maturation protein [Candidatus Methanolliviera sp. GoM_oil]
MRIIMILKQISSTSSTFPYLQTVNLLFVIDAIKGDIPGKVHILGIDDLKRYGKYSLHGFSLFEAVQIAKSMKKELRLQIIGIEGKKFNFNDKISKELLDNIDKIRDEIVGIIKRCE